MIRINGKEWSELISVVIFIYVLQDSRLKK